jgi:hypothetical protein
MVSLAEQRQGGWKMLGEVGRTGKMINFL